MEHTDMIMMGVMSSLRTGNIIVDLAIVMTLPLVFRSAYEAVRHRWVHGRRAVNKKVDRQYRRIITYSRSSNAWNQAKDSHKNRVLVLAIRMYIGSQVKPEYPSGDLKLQDVGGSGNKTVASDSDDDNAEAGGTGSLVEQLEKQYRIVCIPPKNERVELEPGLFFTDMQAINATEDEDGKKVTSKTVTTTLHFSTHVNGGRERVDTFIRKAFEWYVKQIESKEDKSFFMYQPLVKAFSSSDDKNKSQGTVFKKYKLSGEKTFNSIFFPERERVLRVLNHFHEKSGKYAIRGFPHKLGLLLHGPPGTGKTSLVKAVATKMKRHIIAVPLSRIKTNQELMDIMFDQVFPVSKPGKGKNDDDEDGDKTKHSIDEVVFLLEDVDAASNVVHSRTGDTKGPRGSVSKPGELRASASMMAEDPDPNAPADGESTKMMFTTESTRHASVVFEGGDDAKEGAEKAEDDGGQKSDKKEAKKGGKKGDGDDESTDDDPKAGKKKSWLDDPDKLDLAGLLNVLDGVVDAPGRILIMTTNHPEKLDRALLRPGRVNMQIYMGYINIDDAMRMTTHYYPGATPKDVDAVRGAFAAKDRAMVHGLRLSPAEYEQLCAESATLESLISSIHTMHPPR